MRKVKDIATGTRQAGGVINRRQILNIAKSVIRENNPDITNAINFILAKLGAAYLNLIFQPFQ